MKKRVIKLNENDIESLVKKVIREEKVIKEWDGDGEWTDAPIDVKNYLMNNDVVRYTTEYLPKEGKKKWTINAKGQKPVTYTQDFDFSFFEKMKKK